MHAESAYAPTKGYLCLRFFISCTFLMNSELAWIRTHQKNLPMQI